MISGNTGDGIVLNSGASDISIVGNFIGTNVLGSSSLGNQALREHQWIQQHHWRHRKRRGAT